MLDQQAHEQRERQADELGTPSEFASMKSFSQRRAFIASQAIEPGQDADGTDDRDDDHMHVQVDVVIIGIAIVDPCRPS